MSPPAGEQTASAKALRHESPGRRQRGYSTEREKKNPAEPETMVGTWILSKSSDEHGRTLRMILSGLCLKLFLFLVEKAQRW